MANRMSPATEDASLAERTRPGGTRAIIEASLAAIRRGERATLIIVIETEGSTYVRPGAIALFSEISGQHGWLSGGCLEPEIAVRAEQASATSSIAWMEIDTRDDEDLFAGSAVGCRGRLRLALLPLARLSGWNTLAEAWLDRHGDLQISISASGSVTCGIGEHSRQWQLDASAIGWESASETWQIGISAPPAVIVLGAGPETALLVPLLRSMGWMTTLVERRPRWIAQTSLADAQLHENPEPALLRIDPRAHVAALVMHHNFELDREALFALASHPVPFIGLLGPHRRREDLFKVLPVDAREALAPRLHSPIGLKLGGQGPEAIALSIAAQLQAYLHGE